MNRKYLFILTLFLVAGLLACRKEVVETFSGFQQPQGFPQPVYRLQDNPISKAGFELGKKLFFDTRLSRNNTISCGTCHIPTAAFTHHGHTVSHGIDDQLGTRNTPPVMNLAWRKTFMWDGGIFDLDLQPIGPITNHVEMDEQMDRVMDKIRTSADYPALFEKAYGSREITSSRMLKAMSQFMLLCISDQAKYDSVRRGQAVFTETEARGYSLFQAHCGSCHSEPLFTDDDFHNNGLPPSAVHDLGRYPVTLAATDKYKFMTPSLRNLRYTAPFMHDGRFLNVAAVLDHYDHGMQSTENIDARFLQNPSAPGIRLSASEKESLLSFLETLNDRHFISNPLLAEP